MTTTTTSLASVAQKVLSNKTDHGNLAEDGVEALRRPMSESHSAREVATLASPRASSEVNLRKLLDGEDDQDDDSSRRNLHRVSTTPTLSQQPRPTNYSNRQPSQNKYGWKSITQMITKSKARKEVHKEANNITNIPLLDLLVTGTPAGLIMAARFQRDERNKRRVPVLFNQLSITVTDSIRKKGHIIFRIEMQYGTGPDCMHWVVYRDYRDLANLHSRYRLAGVHPRSRPLKLPPFPGSFLPNALGVSKDKKADSEMMHASAASGVVAGLGALAGAISGVPQLTRQDVNLTQRKRVEEYLHELARVLMFRPEANRLFRFLELSNIGLRLACTEQSYHGKEGYLAISGLQIPNSSLLLRPREWVRKYTPKWFVVRHSYIAIVESLSSLAIYDVIFADSDFIIQKRNALEPANLFTSEKADKSSRHHAFRIRNSQQELSMRWKNERVISQFVDSIENMLTQTIWSKQKRFDSFAPVRHKVAAQWLVDGRDYFWSVSRAILRAKEVIYIHDWWLSPELVCCLLIVRH